MNPSVWGEQKPRTIELRTLEAMAKAISGECHAYTVERTSKHRVRVTYANPDEYARDHPITAYFPCYKGPWGEWWVVDAITKIEGCRNEDESSYAYQHFEWMAINELVDPNLLEKSNER